MTWLELLLFAIKLPVFLKQSKYYFPYGKENNSLSFVDFMEISLDVTINSPTPLIS